MTPSWAVATDRRKALQSHGVKDGRSSTGIVLSTLSTSANRRELNLGRHICGSSTAHNNNTRLYLLLIMPPDLGAVRMTAINCAPYSIGRAGCPERDFGPSFNVS